MSKKKHRLGQIGWAPVEVKVIESKNCPGNAGWFIRGDDQAPNWRKRPQRFVFVNESGYPIKPTEKY